MLKVSGYWLIAVSITHGLGDILYYLEPWSDVLRDGIFNTIDPYFDRGTAFWMLMVSPLLFTLGRLCCWAQENRVRLPAFIGWNLLIISVFGAFLMPISGFWLLIPPSILTIVASHSEELLDG
jgi:hypothetical protein